MQDKSWLRLLEGGELPAVGMAQHEEWREWALAGALHLGGFTKPGRSLQNERGLFSLIRLRTVLGAVFLV